MNGRGFLNEDSVSRDVVLIAENTRQKWENLITGGKKRTRKEGIAEDAITILMKVKRNYLPNAENLRSI